MKLFNIVCECIQKLVSPKNYQSIENLWPEWIRDYSRIKAWSESRAFDRRMSIGNKYVFPIIGHKCPQDVTTKDVIVCLQLAMKETNLTQEKVLTALSQFLRWCDSKQLRDSTQRLPTDKELVEPFLGLSLKGKKGHYPALDWRDVPRFVAQLQARRGVSAKALLFVILTASRGQPVREARWDEINEQLLEWNIPAEHMKGKQGNNRPHDVPLSRQAISLLEKIRLVSYGSVIFSNKKPLSDTALRQCIRKINRDVESRGGIGFRDSTQNNRVVVPHGFRAAFMTWAQENDKELSLAERCLAHQDSADKHNGAYRRGVMMRQRRQLLQEWADYCFSYQLDEK